MTELDKYQHPFDAYEHPNLQTKEWTDLNGGRQFLVTFQSGYGASVVSHMYSYGGTEGLWELAVTDDGELCYDTPVTDDVQGYLTEPDVLELLNQIAELDRNEVADFATKTVMSEGLRDLGWALDRLEKRVDVDLSPIRAALLEIQEKHT